MGADLYFTNTFKANQEKYEDKFKLAVTLRNKAESDKEKKHLQKEVERFYNLMYSEGYFRDSYNSYNLLAKFGLSWWKDVIPMLENGNLTPLKAKRLLVMLKQREDQFQFTISDQIVSDFDKVTPLFKDMTEQIQYYNDRYMELQAFLSTAIKSGQSIDCSL